MSNEHVTIRKTERGFLYKHRSDPGAEEFTPLDVYRAAAKMHAAADDTGKALIFLETALTACTKKREFDGLGETDIEGLAHILYCVQEHQTGLIQSIYAEVQIIEKLARDEI